MSRHDSSHCPANDGRQIKRVAQSGLLALSTVVLGLSVCAGAARSQAGIGTAVTADAQRGKAVYAEKGCYQCHGYVGQGALWTAPRLVPQRLSVHDFAAYVRHPSNSMPPYPANLLSDAEVGEIFSYLQSLPAARSPAELRLLSGYVAGSEQGASPSKPPVVTKTGVVKGGRPLSASASPALLNRGADLYRQKCSACHGANLEGGAGPRLSPSPRSAAPISAIIMNPPPAMPRLYPNPLNRTDVEAISAYVNSRGRQK